ncbi:PTS transporter subunit EIIC [Spiroplasma endosymbiont of Crioceris asparagi]|uniref:PTS transporter subunit EIIC n=1 Tax=Spiroplasma endosymbiont of Crioceris asparagi TaxID=3066286 RepID=UPI0030CAB616
MQAHINDKIVEPVKYINKWEVVAEEIFNLVGTNKNYETYQNCMTRLRFVIKDKTKVQETALLNLDIVKGINYQGNELQIIIGGAVYKVKEALDRFVKNDFKFELKNVKTHQEGFDILACVKAIVLPIIPAIMAAGMLQAVYVLLSDSVAGLYPAIDIKKPLINYSWFNVLFYIVSHAGLDFISIFFLYNTVKYFNGNTNVGLLLGIIFISPYFFNQLPIAWTTITVGDVTSTIGIKPYPTSIIPMVAAGIIYVVIDNWIKKWMPSVVDIIFRHFLSVLITSLIIFIAVGNVLGLLESVIGCTLGLLRFIPWGIGTAIFGIFWQAIVITGIHGALIQFLMLPAITNPGTSVPLVMGFVFGTFGQLGGGIGVALKTKNQTLKQQAIGAMPASLFGITEPMIYGVTLRCGLPFITASLGAGAGGIIYTGFFNGDWRLPPAFGILAFVSCGTTASQYIGWSLGVLGTVALSAILTYFTFKDRRDEVKGTLKLTHKLSKWFVIDNNLKTYLDELETFAKTNFKDNKKMEKAFQEWVTSNFKYNHLSQKLSDLQAKYAKLANKAFINKKYHLVKKYNNKYNKLENSVALDKLWKIKLAKEQVGSAWLQQLEVKQQAYMEIVANIIALLNQKSPSSEINNLTNNYYNICHSLDISYDINIKQKPLFKYKNFKLKQQEVKEVLV